MTPHLGIDIVPEMDDFPNNNVVKSDFLTHTDNHPQKKEIIDIINNTDWKAMCSNTSIAMNRLKRHMIFNELKKHGIKEMEHKNIFSV